MIALQPVVPCPADPSTPDLLCKSNVMKEKRPAACENQGCPYNLAYNDCPAASGALLCKALVQCNEKRKGLLPCENQGCPTGALPCRALKPGLALQVQCNEKRKGLPIAKTEFPLLPVGPIASYNQVSPVALAVDCELQLSFDCGLCGRLRVTMEFCLWPLKPLWPMANSN